MTGALTAASFDALISSIRTVSISVTLPALRHTHMGSWALENLPTARLIFCDTMQWLQDNFTQETSNPWILNVLATFANAAASKMSSYHISGLHQNCHHSRQSRHTPSVCICSGGSHIRTGWMCKICLEKKKGRKLSFS